MDSTTITLFKDNLKVVGRNPKEGKKEEHRARRIAYWDS